MAIEGVPIAIGGGEAEHSADMDRMRNFFMFRGQEGWLTANAGNAVPLDTPGSGIKCMPGPFLVNSRFAGHAQESYMSRILTAQTIDTTNVPPQASPRYDLVVANIEDPYISDGVVWPYPGDLGSDSRRLGPYWQIRIIENVPAGTLTIQNLPSSFAERSWTAIPICRLDRPQNTSVVTADMIKNLRSVINPWSGIQLPQEILDNINLLNDTVVDIGEYLEGAANQSIATPGEFLFVGKVWPSLVETTINPAALDVHTAWITFPQQATSTVLIPPWANYVDIESHVVSCVQEKYSGTGNVDADVYGDTLVQIGTWQTAYTPFQFEDAGIVGRPTLTNYAREFIATNMRGKVWPISIKARILHQSVFNGRLRADRGTVGVIKLNFKESP